MNEEFYYVQDSRTVVGNCAMFWQVANQGYTCDLSKARVWTRKEIDAHGLRATDIPRLKDDVDAAAKCHVDIHALKPQPARKGGCPWFGV